MNALKITTFFGFGVATLCILFFMVVAVAEAAVTTYSYGDLGYQWEPVASDARVNGGIYSWHTVRADWESAHRACALIVPSSYATNITTGKFKSPKNNTIVWWGGSIWNLVSAKTFNSYIKGLTCASDALPNPSLSVSPASIQRGESAALTWSAGPYADELQVQCTASNFSVGHVVPGYMSTQWVCGDFFGCFPLPMWVPDQYVEQRSGSLAVSPSTTTTYSYTCSNPNGTVTRTATLAVVEDDEIPQEEQPEDEGEAGGGSGAEQGSGEGMNGDGEDGFENNPQCADGIDNNGDGLVDYPEDPSCASAVDQFEDPLPEASLTLNPNRSIIRSGTLAVLSWRTEHVVAGSCTLSGDNGDYWNLSSEQGTVNSSKLVVVTTFTLSCVAEKDERAVSVKAKVQILPEFQEF